MGNIVTFYSYKGGVGRSMALANVAVLLARRGKKVLAVDWDLEAPGLPRYFAQLKAKQDGLGLLPLLLKGSPNENPSCYKDYVWIVEDTDTATSFDVLSSGHETDPDYSKKLERFDWHSYFREGGGDFFERLRAQWKDDYEIVLIDSRTGLTDSGGICTIQLPDIVVAMFTANYQSLYGVRDVMRLAQQSRQRLSFDRMPLNVIPLASRFGTRSEFRESKKWLDEFASALAEFFAEWLPSSASPRQALERMKIPQVDYFSFGERLAVIEDSSADSEGMTPPYNMLSDLIESDLQNVDTILPPESWRTGSQRESKQRARPTSDGYKYDIYFSHVGDAHTTSWIREEFLQPALRHLEALSARRITTFFDFQEVRADAYWAHTIGDALMHSRVCLAFLTARYFHNPWSVSELATFLKRSRHLAPRSRNLVFPVLLEGNYEHLPEEVRQMHIADFRDYFVTSPAFRDSPKYVEFEDAVRELAGSLVRGIESAPPLDPDWHVVNPNETGVALP